MLRNLKEELKSEFEQQIQSILQNQSRKMPNNSAEYELKSAKLNMEIEVYKSKEQMIVDTMANMKDQITELSDKLEQIDITNAKRTVILSGFVGNMEDKIKPVAGLF